MQGLILAAISTSQTHFNGRLDIKSWQIRSNMKSRSRAPGHSGCLKSMLRTTTMQGMILAAITASRNTLQC